MIQLYGLLSNDYDCYTSRITIDKKDYFRLFNGTEDELKQIAKNKGYDVVHIFIEDQEGYLYQTTVFVEK